MQRFFGLRDQVEKSSPNVTKTHSLIVSIDPRWKFRIRAFLILIVLVVPGNLATLGIYAIMEGKTWKLQSCNKFSLLCVSMEQNDALLNELRTSQ